MAERRFDFFSFFSLISGVGIDFLIRREMNEFGHLQHHTPASLRRPLLTCPIEPYNLILAIRERGMQRHWLLIFTTLLRNKRVPQGYLTDTLCVFSLACYFFIFLFAIPISRNLLCINLLAWGKGIDRAVGTIHASGVCMKGIKARGRVRV